MLERTITENILKMLKRKGIWCYKACDNYTKGIPDIMGCMPDGRLLAIEVKRPDGTASNIQKKNIKHFVECGAVSGIVFSVKEAQRLIDEAMQKEVDKENNQ